MKYLYIIIVFFIGAFISNASANDTISVETKISKLKNLEENLQKAKLYVDIFRDLMYSNPEKAMEFKDAGIEICKKLNYFEGLASILNNCGVIYETWSEYEKALDYYLQSVEYEKKLDNKAGQASSYINIGSIHKNLGDYSKAIEYFNIGKDIYHKLGLKMEESIGWLNIGIIYDIQGIYDEALNCFLTALKMNEDSDNTYFIGSIYMNLGVFYDNQSNEDEALKYYFLALENYNDDRSLSNMSNTYNNIACVYQEKGDLDSALFYFTKSLKLNDQLNFVSGNALVYGNIAGIFHDRGIIDSAIYYNKKAILINTQIKYKEGLTDNYNNLGIIYSLNKQYNKAIPYLEEAFNLAMEIYYPTVIAKAAHELSIAYEKTGNYKKAYEFHVHYKNYSDTLTKEQAVENITRLQMKYEFDKERKVAELEKEQVKIKHEAEIDSKNAKIENQRMLTIFFVVLFIIMGSFAFFIYRSFRQKKRLNSILSEQKEEILAKNEELQQQKEEIQSQRDEIEIQRDLATSQRDQIIIQKKEITDSIHYAKRIQTAVLPDNAIVEEYFSEQFVFFKPRDIVSGDFYWFAKNNNQIVCVAADCTGHGVPGAFMSMLGITLLDEIVNKNKCFNPSLILNKLREDIISALKQHDSEFVNNQSNLSQVRDGMDVSVCTFNKETKKLIYSGANNPLYIVRNYSELIELKPDKMPVGLHLKSNSNYSEKELQVNTNDIIYMFSDGFPDQFGGNDNSTGGKKFLYKNFKQLLLDISAQPLVNQQELLKQNLDNWMNPGTVSYEQIDDILILGLKV
ncbi:MAG: tetratricopeptide repeat protein [Bacteroidales bacterium]|nr:tetratricopeptide repeat protein [Bacteroidales bacterium]